jgi:hypothetical protein
MVTFLTLVDVAQAYARMARSRRSVRAYAAERAIMRQTGHKSAAMVNRYVRAGQLFRDNAGRPVIGNTAAGPPRQATFVTAAGQGFC